MRTIIEPASAAEERNNYSRIARMDAPAFKTPWLPQC
jgi:hypothetical protein